MAFFPLLNASLNALSGIFSSSASRAEKGDGPRSLRRAIPARAASPDAITITIDRGESNDLRLVTLDRGAELMPGTESHPRDLQNRAPARREFALATTALLESLRILPRRDEVQLLPLARPSRCSPFAFRA